MKKQLLRTSVGLVLLSLTILTASPRVTGAYQSWAPHPTTDQIDAVTHLAVFSLGLNSDGSLITQHLNAQLDKLVKNAHSVNTKVIVGVGGWGLSDGFAGATTAKNRKVLVSNLKKLYDSLSLDGFNLDWEFPTPEQMPDYIQTIKLLKDELPATAEIGFAASAETDPAVFPDNFYDLVDIVELMTYDMYTATTGHADWNTTVEALDKWGAYCDNLEKRNINFSRKCITFGLPFYSRAIGFPEQTLTYKQIHQLGGDVTTDRFSYQGNIYSFNGTATITKKCAYAVTNGYAGVMIWAIDHDLPYSNPSSLLKTITTALTTTSILDKSSATRFSIAQLKNTLKLTVPAQQVVTVSLFNVKGERLFQENRNSDAAGNVTVTLDSRFSQGIYLLNVQSSGSVWNSKLIID